LKYINDLKNRGDITDLEWKDAVSNIKNMEKLSKKAMADEDKAAWTETLQ